LAAENGLAASTVADYQRFANVGARLAIYGFPIIAALWVWIVFPDLGLPARESLISSGILLFVLLPLVPLAHELLHLLAMPTRLLRHDTRLFIDIKKPLFKMAMVVKTGGSLTREQFIWISALPLLLLSVLPFGWAVLAQSKPNIGVGIIACMNFAMSAGDMMQIYVLLRYVKFGEVLSGSK